MAKQQQKTVIITGGATGIGFSTAQSLLKTESYRVVLLGRREARLEQAVEDLGGNSDWVSFEVCDLSKEDQIAESIHKILSKHKTIYGLVNNAGIYPFDNLSNVTPKGWDMTFMVNLKAPMLLAHAFAPEMAKHKEGRIVNVSSTAGVLPNQFALSYSVSKAALNHFTKTIAKEVGPNGITVNTICPGIVKTPLHEAYTQDKTALEQFYAKRGASFPMGRVGLPEDVSSAVVYFLSEQASWVTGTEFIVDGGRLLL
jgi:NAD(P)-dependent dehydrogenase (short-subunit alcohol dehydrogenase family)